MGALLETTIGSSGDSSYSSNQRYENAKTKLKNQRTKEITEYKQVLKDLKKGEGCVKTGLAWFLLSGLGGASMDKNEAIKLLKERTEEEDTDAMWMLGLCKEFGIGEEKDITGAEQLYNRSSQKGNTYGRFILEIGISGRENQVSSSKWCLYINDKTNYLSVERVQCLFLLALLTVPSSSDFQPYKLFAIAPWKSLDFKRELR